MDIITFPLGQMQANGYIIIKDKTCLLIDPADSADFLLEELQRRNLDVVGMIATHGHFDHVMAVGEIQLSMPFLPLYAHPEDNFLLDRLEETAVHFLGHDPGIIPVQTLEILQPGKMTLEDFSFEVIHTPGHTPGSCCIYFEEEQVIFTGDTLFNGSVGRYDFKYSKKEQLKESLELLFQLPGEVIVHPGHGEETTIEAEKVKGTMDLLGGTQV